MDDISGSTETYCVIFGNSFTWELGFSFTSKCNVTFKTSYDLDEIKRVLRILWNLITHLFLGYGENIFGNLISPGLTLVFEIELMDIKPDESEMEMSETEIAGF